MKLVLEERFSRRLMVGVRTLSALMTLMKMKKEKKAVRKASDEGVESRTNRLDICGLERMRMDRPAMNMPSRRMDDHMC